MAEFDYEVVNGRKIRVRLVETVSEVDENGYFHRQPNHFTKGFGPGENPSGGSCWGWRMPSVSIW